MDLLAPYAHIPTLAATKAPVYEPVVILKPEMVRVADTARIDSFVKIEGGQGVVLGEHVHIASFSYVNVGGGLVIFEDGAGTACHVAIIAGSNVPGKGRSCSAASPRDQIVIEHKHVIVRRNAMIFTRATVLPGVTIGENAVVGAGAVVRCDVPAFEFWGGIPARKLGMVGEKKLRKVEDDVQIVRELFGVPV